MTTATLLPGFERPVRERWTGNVLPVRREGRFACHRCGTADSMVRLDPYTQDALFFHGGYGASERMTAAVCLACGRSSVLTTETVRPPR